jgi:hypothetical protein
MLPAPCRLQAIVTQHIQTLQQTGGKVATLPKVISRVLNNRACRGMGTHAPPLLLS